MAASPSGGQGAVDAGQEALEGGEAEGTADDLGDAGSEQLQPTAHLEGEETFFSWPPVPKTIRLTLAEAAKLAKQVELVTIGEITELDAGRTLATTDGDAALEHPGLDPFWGAFGRWASEAAGIAEGETSPDGQVTIHEEECLGACDAAPVVQIDFANYDRVGQERIRELVGALRAGEVPSPSRGEAPGDFRRASAILAGVAPDSADPRAAGPRDEQVRS